MINARLRLAFMRGNHVSPMHPLLLEDVENLPVPHTPPRSSSDQGRPVIRVSLRGLAGRKLRAALTAIAIVLGVAMISGTYILTDTIDRAFSQIFTESYAGTDAVVTGKGVDISIDGEAVAAPPVDEAMLETVRAVPEVALATGSIVDDYGAKILTPEGEAIATGGAPSFGFGIDPDPALSRFNPLKLAEGRWPTAENEVVIDAGTADEQKYAVGEQVQISTLEPTRAFELVGVAQYGNVDSLGTATFAVFTIPAAQELFDREGQFDAVSAAAKDGVSEDDLVQAIAAALPADAEVVSATQEAADQSDEISGFTSIIRYFLLAFAGIALFVGSFVIFNTFSITVAQRTREFATLRTIGASRRQVLGSVVLESLVIGLVASLIGLAAGPVARGGNPGALPGLRLRASDYRACIRAAYGRRCACRRGGHHPGGRPLPGDPGDTRAHR